jgi:hypothetical protein
MQQQQLLMQQGTILVQIKEIMEGKKDYSLLLPESSHQPTGIPGEAPAYKSRSGVRSNTQTSGVHPATGVPGGDGTLKVLNFFRFKISLKA